MYVCECVFIHVYYNILYLLIYVYEYRIRPEPFLDNSLYILIDKESV